MKRTWNQHDGYGVFGVIESICLRNFMCHDNLSFEFDPHMNFIIGRNGSGKSAVITGIILALGGKSSSTGRYSNIKSFIKTGKSYALMSVTLKNCGSEAYKPEEFGEKITVERHITSEGTSSYKLKSQAGRIVSTSKEELKNILNFMNIQIENPITVLTQDTSKNFLVSKTSKADKLFQLFFRGTGLAKVKEDYMRSRQHKEEMKAEIEQKKSILPEIEKDIRKLKACLDKSTKITELKKELLWAMVIEFEKKRDKTKAELEMRQKVDSDLRKRMQTWQADMAKHQQDFTSIQADINASNDKINSFRRDLQEIREKSHILSSEHRQVQGMCLSHERQLSKVTSEIRSLESIMNEIKMKNQSDLNEDKVKHEMTLNNLQFQIENIKSQIKVLEQRKISLREDESCLQKKRDACHAEVQDINYRRNNIKKEMEQLASGKLNKINVYGQEMVNVLKEIRRATELRLFKVEPKGPIGLYINVKQPEWNFAVQECLKIGFLRTFLCDNHADADCLTKILNKHFQKNRPSIITTKFVSQVYDVSAHKTVCQHPTLLDLLNISDPVVTNCLIDQNEIENILMIADEKEARKLMLYNPPRKCRFAYTPNGDQYCHSPYRNYSCRHTNQICILKTVNEDDIRKKKDEFNQLEALRSSKVAEEEKLIQQLRANGQEMNQVHSEITDLKIKYKYLDAKLTEEESSYEEPKNFSCLQVDLEQLQTELKHLEEQYVASKTAMDEKYAEMQSLEKSSLELKRNIEIETRKHHTLNEKSEDYANAKEKLESAVKKSKDRLAVVEPEITKFQKMLEDDEATVTVSTLNAADTGDRIDTDRSSDTIRQILKETERFLQKQRNCDQEAMLKEYEEKILHFNKSRADLEKLERTNNLIETMLEERFQAFKKICSNTSVSLCCHFTMLLKENDFTGYPAVDFENQTLEIFAKPEKAGSKLGECSNLSQLSGGERSYVTIAFLLSLWNRINMPFRILDEYDVFMDSSNRHLSINMLVNTAKANKNIQYIFLSPLEMPDLEDPENVKVHKMPAPRK